MALVALVLLASRLTVIRTIATRIGTAFVTLLLVLTVVFLLARLTPGDPFEDESDSVRKITPEQRQELRALYHLDEPLVRQYLLWLRDAARGRLGRSFHDARPVSEKIGERIGTTVLLGGLAILLMVALSFPLGAAAALHPGSPIDRWVGGATYALYAVPVFWAGPLLQTIFSVKLDWLPLYGLDSGIPAASPLGRIRDVAAHLVLPVLCLSYGGLAYLSRFVRASLLESTRLDTTRAARARGLSAIAILIKHGFRLSAVPMLTLAGFLLPALVGGSVLVETIFAVPGLGRLFYDSLIARDLPVLLGLTLLSGSATLAGTLAADLSYDLLDPRARRG